jgi:type II secretory pathway component GspD/PulD (secretin)
MMKLIVALLLVPCLALAAQEQIALKFDAVSLVAFGQGTFNAILQRDFVISPDVLALDRRITINVKSIEKSEVPHFVEDLLAHEGIQTTLRNGIYYLSLKNELRNAAAQESSNVSMAASQQQGAKTDTSGLLDLPGNGDARVVNGVQAKAQRRDDDDTGICEPKNRTSEFVAGILVAGFGSQSAMTAGQQVLVTGTKANVAKMLALCRSIDTPTKSVDVSMSWVEVTSNSGSGRGISLAATVLGAKFGASLGVSDSPSVLSFKNTNFELVIDALNSDGRFKQISNSRVFGEDRTKIGLIVGDETPTLASTGSDNAGNRVQNIVYRPSGVIIDVLPKVLGNGKIRMELEAQISSFKATLTGVSGSPTQNKRQVRTTVGINDGDVVVIGGLADSQQTETSSRFAFLPPTWSVKSRNSVQTDLVLILTAKVSAP